MMDRERFRNRARELRAFAERMLPLAKMPDRVTASDLQIAADLATKAADTLDELIKAKPVGCICRHIEHDDYSYLDYAKECLHHGQLHAQSTRLKAEYLKMEKTLHDEVRMKLVAAALSGTAGMASRENQLRRNMFVDNAITIADETIRRLTESE